MIKYGEGILFDNLEGVGGRLVGIVGGVIGEVLYIKIVFIVSVVCVLYLDLLGKLLVWGCLMVVLLIL